MSRPWLTGKNEALAIAQVEVDSENLGITLT